MKPLPYRATRLGALAAMLALAACSSTPPPRPRPAPRPAPAPAPRPAPAPAPAPEPERSDQGAYDEGLALYRKGAYNQALMRFATVRTPPALRVQALKYSAFSYCVTNRLVACELRFREALRLSPGFRLSRAEQGHPVWDPVFQKALRASGGR